MIYAMFRLDAGSKIGIGHFYRCLTIANSISKMGISSDFYVNEDSGSVADLATKNGHSVKLLKKSVNRAANQKYDYEESKELASGRYYKFIFVDHYSLSKQWELSARNLGEKIIVIDDLANRNHDCDYLIDTLSGRDSSEYKDLVSSSAKLLVGGQYSIIRPDFLSIREKALKSRSQSHYLKNILVSFGGTDPNKLTLLAIKSLLQNQYSEKITVVISSVCSWIDELENICIDYENIELNVDTVNMEELILNSDLAIGSSGVSSIERCFLGLPSIVLVFADNQIRQAEQLSSIGAITFSNETNLNRDIQLTLESLSDDVNPLSHMSERCFSITDGFGVYRIVQALTVDHSRKVTLRKIDSDDIYLLYMWQMDPNTRRYFHNQAIPDFETHKNWYSKCMDDTGISMYITLLDGVPCGYIRANLIDRESAFVSIYIDPYCQNRGVGKESLSLVSNELKGINLFAEVLKDNEASKSLFMSNGFKLLSDVDGLETYKLVG